MLTIYVVEVCNKFRNKSLQLKIKGVNAFISLKVISIGWADKFDIAEKISSIFAENSYVAIYFFSLHVMSLQ